MNQIYFTHLGQSLAYIAVAFVIFFIGKFVYSWFHPQINVKSELVEKDNLAFSIAHVGYFVGLIFVLGGAIIGPSNGLLFDLIDLLLFGLIGILLLNLSTLINDKIILKNFSVYKEIIVDGNVGTGVIEAASTASAGLIIFGALIGETTDVLFGILTAISFWVIGQVVLILTAWFYNKITKYDVHYYIEKDNVAVGLGFAGALVAIANILRFALSAEFVSWQVNISELFIDIVIGLAVLPVTRYLTDRILLPGQKLTDELIHQEKPNVGAGLIECFAYIGGSVIITWCL